jgi:hypothetical protein
MSHQEIDFVALERLRIQAEYRRREHDISREQYAVWQPAEILARAGMKRTAATLLHRAAAFPAVGQQCLEIGFGGLGWLGDLISWGIRETDIHGIELDKVRADRARKCLPQADLRNGDASSLPWLDNSFQLVILSTVLSSILNNDVRILVASEATRVIAPGGVLLWYDFAFNNPRNPNVRKIDRWELKQLFPRLSGEIKAITLAPPIARFVAPRSWWLAAFLESIPLCRTHLLAVLKKDHD